MGVSPGPAHCPPTVASQPLVPCLTPSSCSPLTLLPFQNIVHLRVFDQDLLTTDDPMLSVLFDVGTLRAGESRHESFSLSPQVRLCVGPWRALAQGGAALEGLQVHGSLLQ